VAVAGVFAARGAVVSVTIVSIAQASVWRVRGSRNP
jgi:hypothetical protein